MQSLWISEQFGRKVIKAWNAINTGSFDSKATPVGHPDRIAIPGAGDSDAQRALAMSLVEETGFDAFDAGNLEQSWRQQPGTPVYCTDFTKEKVADALAAADKWQSIRRRDLMIQVNREILNAPTSVRGEDTWSNYTASSTPKGAVALELASSAELPRTMPACSPPRLSPMG